MNLIRIHQPSIMIIIETRVGGDRAKELTDQLPFKGALHADTYSYAGGIWLLWHPEVVDISKLASTEQEIHALVKVKSFNFSWLLSAIYASPRAFKRYCLWDNLSIVWSIHDLPWVLLGDFKEVLCNDDKFGGNPVNIKRALKFKDCLDVCGMMDLGFCGPKFTWSNLRNIRVLIFEKLDRCFANVSCRSVFPEAVVQHLTRIHSDHNPILLKLFKDKGLGLPKPFRFQSMWLSHPTYSQVVRDAWANNGPLVDTIADFSKRVQNWNKAVFGNVFQNKRRLEARLNGIQRTLANGPNDFLIDLDRKLRLEYHSILQLEEDLWISKSRLYWKI
nr:uncharacterized protein LOC112025518 [Quercus suber]